MLTGKMNTLAAATHCKYRLFTYMAVRYHLEVLMKSLGIVAWKLSNFHLVSHKDYRRLIQFRKKKENIKVAGSLSLDSISQKKYQANEIF